MGFLTFTLKRLIVLAIAIALIVLSIIEIASGPATWLLVISIIVLVCSVLGALGAIVDDIRWLQLFLLTEIALFIAGLVYIIVKAVANESPSSLIIAMTVVLFVGALFTASVIRGDYYASGVGGPVVGRHAAPAIVV
jgi:predicted neutral ceramidase superfamily lipid hydrolase